MSENIVPDTQASGLFGNEENLSISRYSARTIQGSYNEYNRLERCDHLQEGLFAQVLNNALHIRESISTSTLPFIISSMKKPHNNNVVHLPEHKW